MGRPRPVVVALVVWTFIEAVGDARLLPLRGVVVALVAAGGAMGSGASDGPGGCAGSDADGVGAVAAVMWKLVPRGWWRWRRGCRWCLPGCRSQRWWVGVGGATGCRPGCGRSLGCCGRQGLAFLLVLIIVLWPCRC